MGTGAGAGGGVQAPPGPPSPPSTDAQLAGEEAGSGGDGSGSSKTIAIVSGCCWPMLSVQCELHVHGHAGWQHSMLRVPPWLVARIRLQHAYCCGGCPACRPQTSVLNVPFALRRPLPAAGRSHCSGGGTCGCSSSRVPVPPHAPAGAGPGHRGGGVAGEVACQPAAAAGQRTQRAERVMHARTSHHASGGSDATCWRVAPPGARPCSCADDPRVRMGWAAEFVSRLVSAPAGSGPAGSPTPVQWPMACAWPLLLSVLLTPTPAHCIAQRVLVVRA